MKISGLSTILLLCAALATGLSTPTDRHFSAVFSASSSLAATSRRPSPVDHSDAAKECILQCGKQMDAQLTIDVPGVSLGPYPGRVNGTQMEKVCGLYNTMKTCLSNCPNNDLKTFIEKMTSIMQFMCHDSTYKQHAQCIFDATKSVQTSCDSDSKCGQYKKKVEHYDQEEPRNEEQYQDMLKSTCQLIKCARDCTKPAVGQRCGSPAKRDVVGLAAKGIEYLKYIVDKFGFTHLLPQECHSFVA